MDIDLKVLEAIDYGKNKLGYQSLRQHQKKCVESFLEGEDVFVCAPTGSGKSLCFEIAPYAIECMRYGLEIVKTQKVTKTVVLVVAPLVSLMKDQISSLSRKGLSAFCIGPESTKSDVADVIAGKYNLIFGSPEAILNSYRTIFMGHLKNVLGAVFVDESHCIEKWYEIS